MEMQGYYWLRCFVTRYLWQFWPPSHIARESTRVTSWKWHNFYSVVLFWRARFLTNFTIAFGFVFCFKVSQYIPSQSEVNAKPTVTFSRASCGQLRLYVLMKTFLSANWLLKSPDGRETPIFYYFTLTTWCHLIRDSLYSLLTYYHVQRVISARK